MGKESDVADDAAQNLFRFQGFYIDPGTGTYDMQARAYQPSTGRFLQQDRFEDPSADLTLAADPLTSSRYAFTAGNPGTRSEYDGHVPTYTSGDEPKDKHNSDAAAKGADSPGRRAERQQYDASIAVQDAYYQATGRPLKGEGSHIGPLPPLRAAAAAKGGGGSPSILRRVTSLVGQAVDRPIIAANVYGEGATPRDVASTFMPDVNRIYETYLRPQGCTMVLEAGCYSGLRLGDPGRSSTAEKAGDVTTAFGGAMLRAGWLAGAGTEGAIGAAVSGGPRFSIAPRVAHQLQDKRLKHLAGKFETSDLQRLINEPSAQRMLDTKSSHINVVQNIEGVPFRITTTEDEFRIISVGPMRPRQVPNGYKSGRYIPLR